MKKPDMKNSFKNKKFRYGGYAAMVTSILIAILIVVNLFVSELGIRIDLTQEKLYSLSQQSFDALKDIKEDIKIYGLYEAGKEEPVFKEIIEKYKKASDKIKVEYKDPVLYPQFTSKYKKPEETIAIGSIIVESASGKFKVISPYDLVNYSQASYGQQPQAQSLAVEQRITGAIAYVTSDKNPKIFVLNGHNEEAISAQVKQQLEKENFEVADINLTTQELEASEVNILFLGAPKKDLSKDDADKIIKFLEAGGRAVILADYFSVQTELPNFKSVLERYGIAPQKGIVIEGDANNRYQNPLILLPSMPQHDITSSIITAKLPVVVPKAIGLKILDEKKRTTEIETLLSSTNNSWLKTNEQSQTVEKEDGDIDGPINIALAVKEDSYEDNKVTTTKLIVVGNTDFIGSNLQLNTIGNLDFIMNSFNWLQDQKQSISIRPKSIVPQALNVNQKQGLLFAGLFVILIPIVVLAYGITVWLRRRHL